MNSRGLFVQIQELGGSLVNIPGSHVDMAQTRWGKPMPEITELKAGDYVRMNLKNGQTVKGRLKGIIPEKSNLVLGVGNGEHPYSFSYEDIDLPTLHKVSEQPAPGGSEVRRELAGNQPSLKPEAKAANGNERREPISKRKGTVDEPRHMEMLKRRFTPPQADKRGDELLAKLDSFLIRLRKKMQEVDFEDPKNHAVVDSFMRGLFKELNDPRILEGTGYHATERNNTLTMGMADIDGWVTQKNLRQASHALARKAQLMPGRIKPPDAYQKIDGNFFTFEEMTPQDQNNRLFYVEKFLISLEEFGHLAQQLFGYGGRKDGSANLSPWGRGLGYAIDSETDVAAWLQQGMGKLHPAWFERYNRGVIPRDLPLLEEPR